MPGGMSERDAIVLDPMLATGNSAVAAVERLKEAKPRSIRFVCLVSCPEGIRTFQAAHPGRADLHGVDRPRAERPRLHPARAGRRRRPDLRHQVGGCRSPASRASGDFKSGRPAVAQRHAARRAHRHRRARHRREDRQRRAAHQRRRARDRRRAGLSADAALRRRALPHGCDAVLRPAARERERHAARGHRAVGRVEAHADAGRDRRARARLLRLGGGQGPARHPLARRRLRSAAARRGGAAAREGRR